MFLVDRRSLRETLELGFEPLMGAGRSTGLEEAEDDGVRGR